MRIIDAEPQAEHAFDVLEDTLSAWAGGKSDIWQRLGRGGVTEEGASFARRDDVYLFIERSAREFAVGVALTEKDRTLIRIEINRREPAKDRKRAAAALGEAGEPYLMVSVEELKRQNVRDPLRRLAGTPQVKRANVSDRDYLLLGPLGDPRAADALMALGALHPEFERHVEKLGQVASTSDDQEEFEVYRVSPAVQRQHRVQAKVIQALFERFRAAGFHLEDLRRGVLKADFAVRRGDILAAFEIRSDALLEDFLKAFGLLVLVAPQQRGLYRVVAMPAPRDPLAQTLVLFDQAFRELNVALLFYDFRNGETVFLLQSAPDGFPTELRNVFG